MKRAVSLSKEEIKMENIYIERLDQASPELYEKFLNVDFENLDDALSFVIDLLQFCEEQEWDILIIDLRGGICATLVLLFMFTELGKDIEIDIYVVENKKIRVLNKQIK